MSGDRKDLLYVGTDGNGVHFISVSRQRVIRTFRHDREADSQIRSNSVYSVLVDRDGLLWIGFYQLGVDYTLFQSDLFSTYQYENLFDSRDMAVRTIAFHGSQKLIGSRDGFVFIDEADGRFQIFKAPRLRASIIVSSCYFDGKYYIGTYGGGMYVLDGATLELRDFEIASEPFQHGHILCFVLTTGEICGLVLLPDCIVTGTGKSCVTSRATVPSCPKATFMRFILIHPIKDGFVRKAVSASGTRRPKA